MYQCSPWFGADVLKVERTTGGDVTRKQLRDIPDVDALYFTMLNSNKRSLAINTKTPEGMEVLEKLISDADVLVENFAPGAMDRMGLTWERIQELNPRLIFGSVKGFNDDSPWTDLKVYENVAQCAGGAASTTGFWDGPPTICAPRPRRHQQRDAPGDGILTALLAGRGPVWAKRFRCPCRTRCSTCAGSSCATSSGWSEVGYLEEYPQYPNGTFTDVVPRGGNAGGGGQPGWVLKCKGWETDPNAYIYFTIQEQNWEHTAARSAAPSGPTTRRTTPRRPASRTSSRSSTRSRSGSRTRPSTRRWTSCVSGRCPAPR